MQTAWILYIVPTDTSAGARGRKQWLGWRMLVHGRESQDEPDQSHAWLIRAWHLAILRFAVTLDHADKLAVFAAAAEIDGIGVNYSEERRFRFFRRMSTELCASIARSDATADAVLRQYLARIDDARLRHAFAAVTGIEPRPAAAIAPPPKPEISLWRGLPSRRSTSA
jgi:hypothetical protein